MKKKSAGINVLTVSFHNSLLLLNEWILATNSRWRSHVSSPWHSVRKAALMEWRQHFSWAIVGISVWNCDREWDCFTDNGMVVLFLFWWPSIIDKSLKISSFLFRARVGTDFIYNTLADCTSNDLSAVPNLNLLGLKAGVCVSILGGGTYDPVSSRGGRDLDHC